MSPFYSWLDMALKMTLLNSRSKLLQATGMRRQLYLYKDMQDFVLAKDGAISGSQTTSYIY